jgi:DNA-binding transcriptional LysR family regulator
MTESDLERFVAVADAGSLAEAARDLHIPRETLSRQISRLEERLGVELLHRSTRRLVPTEAGLELLRRARVIVELTREAQDAVRAVDGIPRGVLRVTAPPMGEALGEIVAEYLRLYPSVRIDLDVTTRHLDLVGEGFDVAIRAGSVTDGSLVSKMLLRNRLMAVASPSLLAKYPGVEGLEDLRRLPCIRGYAQGERPHDIWPLLDGGQIEVAGPFASNDLEVQIAAAKEGVGVALAPERLARSLLDDGRLHAVLLVWPATGALPPKTRAFIDLCAERLVPAFERGRSGLRRE